MFPHLRGQSQSRLPELRPAHILVLKEPTMGEQRKIEMSVSQELAEKLDAAVDAGAYRNLADLISDMLDSWSSPHEEKPGRLRQLWEEGLASGEPVEGGFDPADIHRRGLERLKALRAQ
jgi:antitoxin ParD1/3/4